MEWPKLLSSKRLSIEDVSQKDQPGRSVFHKDCDRVVFSSSFRRLGKKTQVHPLASNDHIHTRLTHTIEVASVGRSLGINIGERLKHQMPSHISPANLGQIVQAACLSHDIGNPPFGHAGEEAIKNWFRQPKTAPLLQDLEDHEKLDFINFEGNAQGFRVVSQLEYYPCEGGMRLTYATLAAMLKYPWTSRETTRVSKFSCFRSEENILTKIAAHVGLVQYDEFKWCRHPLAFLTEAADDICYRILDLEDARELGTLSFYEIFNILKPLCADDPKIDQIITNTNISDRRKMSYLRGKSIGKAIEGVTEVYIKNIDGIMDGKFREELISQCSDDIKGPLNEAKRIAKEKIFNHPRKIELEIGSYSTLGVLLETFCNAVREQVTGKTLSFRSERVLKMMGINAPRKGDSLYHSYMQVMDYISGMTDSYATHMAKQIGGMAL